MYARVIFDGDCPFCEIPMQYVDDYESQYVGVGAPDAVQSSTAIVVSAPAVLIKKERDM